jgi:hypothetical protein
VIAGLAWSGGAAAVSQGRRTTHCEYNRMILDQLPSQLLTYLVFYVSGDRNAYV